MSNAWIQTYTGRKFFPLDPKVEDIDIDDIAHGLAMTCRYNRQAKVFYSVAQHSVLVAENVPPTLALRALLHDAHEAYSPFGDVPRPVKHDPNVPASVSQFVDQVEHNIDRAVAARFDLPFPIMDPVIKEADSRILFDERAVVMTYSGHDWSLTGQPLGITIDPWPWQIAREKFLLAFERYSKWQRQLGLAA